MMESTCTDRLAEGTVVICISVTPKSRKLAKADLLNAARQCDLVELCLDHLIKEPDVGDLVAAIDVPVLVTCRRQQDGGHWEGTEDERLQLLRQAIVVGPAFVELDLDIAGKVPRFGDTKRVVSFTSTDSIRDLETVYQQAVEAQADVVRFAAPVRTLDAAWPLVAGIAQSRTPPIVATGLGRAGLMLALLGRKFGSPWIYAALEKGMEAFPGQPTIAELDAIYRWREINSDTRFVGVCGFGNPEARTVTVLNAGFDELQQNRRCLPLAWGRVDKLPTMMKQLGIRQLLVNASMGEAATEVDSEPAAAVADTQFCDLLLRQEGRWQAHNTLWASALRVTEQTMAEDTPSESEDRPLDRRSVLIIGANGAARAVVHGFRRRRCTLSITDPDDDAARELAEKYDLRHVPFAAVYDTLADVVVFADESIPVGHRKTELNPSMLKPAMTVVDISRLPDATDFLTEARERGCRVVDPLATFADRMRVQFPALTGAQLPEGLIDSVLSGR